MSLINQMLRDLDAQAGEKTVTPQIGRPVSIASPASRSGRPVFLTGLVFLVLLVAGGWYLQPVWLGDLLPDSSALNLSAVNANDIPAEAISVQGKKAPAEKTPVEIQPLQSEKVIEEVAALVGESPAGKVNTKQESRVAVVSTAMRPSDSEKTEALQRAQKLQLEQKLTSQQKILADTAIKIKSGDKPADSRDNAVADSHPGKVKPVVNVATVAATKEPVKSLPVTKRQIRQAKDEVAFEAALEFFNQGRLSEAEQSLWLSLRHNPRKLEARKLLTTLLLRGERTEEAGSLLDQGLQLDPGHSPFVTLRARIWLDAGENEKAIYLLQQSLSSKGGDIDLLSLLGSLFQQEQRFQSALEIYRRMVDLEPESARAWAGLAISLDALEQDISAVKAYRHALDLHRLPDEVEQYARQRIELLASKTER